MILAPRYAKIARCLGAVAILAASVTGKAGATEETLLDRCADQGSVADRIMRIRQQDFPIEDVLKLISVSMNASDKEVPEDLRETYMQMVYSAFETPLVKSNDAIDQVSADFRNAVELECYKSTKSETVRE